MASICPLRAREFTSEPSMQECIGDECAWRGLCGKERDMEVMTHIGAFMGGTLLGALLMAMMAASGRKR